MRCPLSVLRLVLNVSLSFVPCMSNDYHAYSASSTRYARREVSCPPTPNRHADAWPAQNAISKGVVQMTGQWVRWVGPGRRNCKLGCGPIFRVMWAVAPPLAEIRFMLDGYQRPALASLVRFWRRLSIKNPPIPVTLSFVSSLTDRDLRKPPLQRLDNYASVHSLYTYPHSLRW